MSYNNKPLDGTASKSDEHNGMISSLVVQVMISVLMTSSNNGSSELLALPFCGTFSNQNLMT